VRGDFQKNRNEFIALLLGISFSSPEFMELQEPGEVGVQRVCGHFPPAPVPGALDSLDQGRIRRVQEV
jgi:hypothetical protein